MPAKDKHDRETDGLEPDETREPSAVVEPDVYLDVPQVDVEELIVDVDDLRARVSLSVEVLDLVRLNVGADVALGKVHLDLKGVHAQALLKVRLDRIAEIVGRVLATVDKNPQVLEQTLSAVERTIKPVAEGGRNAIETVGEDVGETVESVPGTAERATENVGKTVESVPETAERTTENVEESSAERQPKKRAAKKKATKKTAKKAARKRSS